MNLKERMVTAIQRELELRKDFISEPVETLYFGGGTPSLLNEREMEAIIGTVYSTYQVTEDVELTIEVNPEDVSRHKIEHWLQVGVNRLSVGIQSFEPDVLSWMNRAHNSEQAHKALEKIAASFPNYTLDIIYGVATRRNLQKDLEMALSYNPVHISAYALTIEPKTAFGNWHKNGKLQTVDEDNVAEEFMIIHDTLTARGFSHYEVSNYAREGFESKHNTSYWKSKPYVGIGPSAHSYNGTIRSHNLSNNARYIQALGEDKTPDTEEVLSKTDKINDYLLTGLRTRWGINLKTLRLMDYPTEEKMAWIERCIQMGKMERDGSLIKLTPDGFLLADSLAMEMFL